ncbi:MAG: RagB/SusD family nutrient uptake outer membrane protein [Bacteroidales bacterium]|nr:RagB/SusD family nutrient uptake outer membrane protein [Bacteroidales bacterium]
MKTRNIILAALASLTVCACSLDEYPYGFYSEENFYKTDADALAATNYIYDAINYIEYSRAIVFLGDMNTDVMYPKGDAKTSTKELDGWKPSTFKTNTTLNNFYHYSYITINRANVVIENVAAMKDLDEDTRNQYVGEAYFMRAYSYFNLARNFGRVPMHLKPVRKLEDATVGAAKTLDEVWNQIFDDLDKAISLTKIYPVPVTGRTDRIAAYSLASFAYLYLATAKETGVPQYVDMSFNVDDYYSKAVEYAGHVVDDPAQTTYGLDPNLMDIYDVEKPTGPEHIFLMSMDRTGETEGQYSKISKMYIPYIAGGTVYIKNGDTGELIPTHDGWSEYCTQTEFYNSFEAGDLRHDWLFCTTVYNADGIATFGGDSGKSLSYPFCRKFIDPEFVGEKTSTKPFLIRYSEVALTYAEAAGPTPKAYELVNAIRSRAGLGPLASGMTTSAFREAVRSERVFELAFEGHLCYDFRRLNKLHTDITAAREQGLTAEEMVFYPIPSLETDLNPYIE